MNIPKFTERKKYILNNQKEPEFFSGKEAIEKLLPGEKSTKSASLLDQLGNPKEMSSLLLDACQLLKEKMNIEIEWIDSNYILPDGSNNVSFKNTSQYIELPEVLTNSNQKAVVIHEIENTVKRPVAYTLMIEHNPKHYHIELIDVDRYSRVSSKVSVLWKYKEHDFKIGLAHVLVSEIVQKLSKDLPKPGKITTVARTSRSRFVFSSFGFSKRDRESTDELKGTPLGFYLN